MSEPADPSDWAWWMVCPRCKGEYQIFVDGEYEDCPDCEGQGEVCDRCGVPPSHQVSEDEWSGGCWCHY